MVTTSFRKGMWMMAPVNSGLLDPKPYFLLVPGYTENMNVGAGVLQRKIKNPDTTHNPARERLFLGNDPPYFSMTYL